MADGNMNEINPITAIFFGVVFIVSSVNVSQKGELSNAELRILTEELGRIRYGDNEARIKHISIRGLIPGEHTIHHTQMQRGSPNNSFHFLLFLQLLEYLACGWAFHRSTFADTEHYMTYEGSTTAPGCHETVTWIVLNKPIYITLQQVSHAHNITHHIIIRSIEIQVFVSLANASVTGGRASGPGQIVRNKFLYHFYSHHTIAPARIPLSPLQAQLACY